MPLRNTNGAVNGNKGDDLAIFDVKGLLFRNLNKIMLCGSWGFVVNSFEE